MGFSWLWLFVVAVWLALGFIGLSWPVVACCGCCCGCYDPEAVRLALVASGVPDGSWPDVFRLWLCSGLL